MNASASMKMFAGGDDIAVTLYEAVEFHREMIALHEYYMVVAAYWRYQPEEGEEDFFEELTADELDDEYFYEDFAGALFQLWRRGTVRSFGSNLN